MTIHYVAPPRVTTTTLTAQPNPTTAPAHTTMTARVSGAGSGAAPTGTVRFADGAKIIGSAVLARGTATLPVTLDAGTHRITANYVAAAGFVASARPSPIARDRDFRPGPMLTLASIRRRVAARSWVGRILGRRSPP